MPTPRGFYTTDELRTVWSTYRCQPYRASYVPLPAGGYYKTDTVLMGFAPETVPAWIVFSRLMGRHNVTFDELAGGSYHCRTTTGGTGYSTHAYLIALDLNPSQNPYGDKLVVNLPRPFLDAVLALRTSNGRRVFRWGGDWDDDPSTPHRKYDAMHFEISCSPKDLASGIVPTVDPTIPTISEEPMLPLYEGYGTGKYENRKSDVALIQQLLNRAFGAGLKTDGVYGAATTEAVRAFLGVDGGGNGPFDGKAVFGNNAWPLFLSPGPAGRDGRDGVDGKNGRDGLPGPAPTSVSFNY